MRKKRSIYIIIGMIICGLIVVLSGSYALFTYSVTKNDNFSVNVGSLELSIINTKTENVMTIENAIPIKDNDALSKDGYVFEVKNTGTLDVYYSLYLDDENLNEGLDRLDSKYVRTNIYNNGTSVGVTKNIDDFLVGSDRQIVTGTLKAGESIFYTLRLWVNYDAGNDAQNKYFAVGLRVVGTQVNLGYKESILNGCDPVVKDNLIPVTIDNNGVVKKADINKKWYSYIDKLWANAIILKNEEIISSNDEVIPEDNIESYFVWIPRYRYKIFDDGNYTELTSVIDVAKTIEIEFENKNTNISEGTSIGEWLTHPAFISSNTNGMWVDKY